MRVLEVVVRAATPADMPAVGRLGALMIEEHHAFDAQRFIAPGKSTADEYARFLSTQIEGPDSAVLVAEAEGGVIGYAYAALEGWDYMALRAPAGALHDVLVEPAHRGRGVGTLLLDAALAFLKARGAPRVVLSTAEQNEGARRLFARAGFRRTMVEMTREL